MQVESRITEVTLYARGARVRRAATIAVTSADSRVRIAGLPAAVIDDSVRIEAEGGAVVTAVHVGVEAPAPESAASEDSHEVRAARLRLALAGAEVERLDAALAILAAAPIALADPSDEAPPAWASLVEARRMLVTLRAERELALRDQLIAARYEADEAARVLAAAVDRDRRAGSGRPAKLHELRKHVELELEGAGTATVYLEYQVAAARWSPSYVARLDGERVVFALRATVAQDTGEDWTSVRLRLSTAEPEQFGGLPELPALRIGRRQAEPVRSGFRAPPIGAAALYLDYERAFSDGEPTRRIGIGRIAGEFEQQVMDASRAAPHGGAPLEEIDVLGGAAFDDVETVTVRTPKRSRGGTRPGEAMSASRAISAGFFAKGAPPAPSAPSPAQSFAPSQALSLGASAPPPPPAPPAPRLDYTNLRMAPPEAADRGQLVPAPRDRLAPGFGSHVAAAVARVMALALPSGSSAEWPHTYDYAFATDGTVDVRSDGAWHSIAVTAVPGRAVMRHVTVPREQVDVFRMATIANPLAGPLLPGPIDVYDRGTFLVTSTVEHTPPGAAMELGLGVDPRVKLSRNTEFREETTGVLRGGLRLHHAIKIDVENLAEAAIDLEVRERLPVTRDDDDDVEIVVGRIDPAWERFTPDSAAPRERRLRGGYRWRLSVPAGGKRALRAAYEVRIAGKHELVGGNRRES